MSFRSHLCISVLLVAAGCASHGASSPLPGAGHSGAASSAAKKRTATPIQHVVVVIQENRSFDHFFQGFQGANTQNFGLNHLGQQVPLVQVPINQDFDAPHNHGTFVTEADLNPSTQQYAMDGFDLVAGCKGRPSCAHAVYTYVQQSDVANYWTFAQQYAIADETFQSNMGTSWTAHQYLIAGQAGGYNSNHLTHYGDPGSAQTCGSQRMLKYPTFDMTQPYPGVNGAKEGVCMTYTTIFNEMDTAGVTWKYYARAPSGFWTAPENVQSLFTNDQAKIIVPETQVLADIANHQLAQVSYVTPADTFSDHPYPNLTNHGQDWLALIANSIGGDPYYWNNTVILVMWDDWGGYYDHVPPPHAIDPFLPSGFDPNEYGMRVGFIVIGPYVVPHVVNHTVRADAAVLTFLETVFNLPSLGTLDTQQDNLMGFFNFSQPANVYQMVTTHGWSPSDARRAGAHSGPIDSDLP